MKNESRNSGCLSNRLFARVKKADDFMEEWVRFLMNEIEDQKNNRLKEKRMFQSHKQTESSIEKRKKINMEASGQKIRCLVFSTNLHHKTDVEGISKTLNSIPGLLEWSVDLEDWEKVLRIECVGITANDIIDLLQKKGYSAKEMLIEYL